MGIYNALPRLNDALASILNQTLSDYEVVLVDDGSTDGSAEVCDAFAVPSRFLRTFRQPLGTPSGTATRRAASRPGSGGTPIRSPRRT